MNYSFRHKEFACYFHYNYGNTIKNILEHPEKYLGPNYKELLNFWFYLDCQSGEQRKVYWNRYWELDYQTQEEALKIAGKLSPEVIDSRFVGRFSILELEIIASHLYIERNIPFTFIPLIFDL
jgi:hypothetical protein